MIDIILDTLIDGIKIIPFLFCAFLFIELLEHNLNKKTKKVIAKSGKYGPIFGSILGMLPQCGFSVMATNLYVTRIITLGTLISIYLSTSDEMLPILLSHNVSGLVIIKILGIKVLVGMISGFIIDLIIRKKTKVNLEFEMCDEEHCHCKESIIKSSITHTLKTLLFIMLVSFVLNVLMEYVGQDTISKLFLKNSIFGPFLGGLIGLIPNCGASVMLTELYLSNAISLSTAMAGLLTGSGVALLVLFKSNKNMKENLSILGIIYGIGVISGLIIEIIEMI